MVTQEFQILDIFGLDKKLGPVYNSYRKATSYTSWKPWSGRGKLFSALAATVSAFFGRKPVDVFAMGDWTELTRMFWKRVCRPGMSTMVRHSMQSLSSWHPLPIGLISSTWGKMISCITSPGMGLGGAWHSLGGQSTQVHGRDLFELFLSESRAR